MKDPHTLLLKIARSLELLLAAAILVIIVIGALLLVMGLEFVKMLALHTAAAVIDVLLFTIARQMIITHGSSLDTLLGVGAVAGIFAIRKFLRPDESASL